MYRSVYTEYSLDNKPFKTRNQYNIDWERIVDISKKCGMISVNEEVSGNRLKRITIWSRETSYIEWVLDSYVREYIIQRDNYNKENNITSELIFEECHDNKSYTQ